MDSRVSVGKQFGLSLAVLARPVATVIREGSKQSNRLPFDAIGNASPLAPEENWASSAEMVSEHKGTVDA